MDYIDNTWKPASWMVYCQSVRTNNDVEGWYHRINKKAQKPNLQMYILIILLHKEARLITDSTQDGHRGKTSTLPKKENQGAAAQDFRLVGQVQWRRDHRQSITEEMRQDLWRPVMIWQFIDFVFVVLFCLLIILLRKYYSNKWYLNHDFVFI